MLLLAVVTSPVISHAQTEHVWRFALSGDSRNCGDVVMPAIAAGVRRDGASFYWHLGDFRAIYDFDQDVKERAGLHKLTISEYEKTAWQDFIKNQLEPFSSTPVFLGLGNHETIPPKSKSDALIQFADWLNASEIQLQRLKDNPEDHRVKAYYHWNRSGIDFVNLDNSSPEQFDDEQVKWLQSLLDRDAKDAAIETIVVGMHAALPDSLASSHSMSDAPQSRESGRKVYKLILQFQQTSMKHVYVFASHSHFYMSGIFDTEYWHANGGVLPGWIVGTAGAERYALPSTAPKASEAITNVYGYLLGTVHQDDSVTFEFRHIQEMDVPSEVVKAFGQSLVHDCFEKNRAGAQ